MNTKEGEATIDHFASFTTFLFRTLVKQHNVYTTSHCRSSSDIKMYSYYGREAEQNRDLQWKTDINISQSDQISTRILDAKNSLENQLDFVLLDHKTRFSISRSRLETRNGNKEFPFFPMEEVVFIYEILRKLTAFFFGKYQSSCKKTNQIFKNSRENFIKLDPCSRLEVWDWR